MDIETGTSPLSVPAIGQVEEVLVRDGDKVKAGQPLVRLDGAQSVAMVERARRRLPSAKRRFVYRRRSGVPENHRLLIEKQEQAIAADKSRLEGHRRQGGEDKKLSETSRSRRRIICRLGTNWTNSMRH
ncbi:MAG: biotin/lipoyl-binding protein [Planctomycetota bacterium]